MNYFKVLDEKNHSCKGGNRSLVWNLPVQNTDGMWTPGEWMPEVTGDLVLCNNGYHLTDTEHLLDWLDSSVYEAEPSTELLGGDDKIVCRSVRLLRKMNWDDRIERLFACSCADRVLYLYEREFPNDPRPRNAIKVARLYVYGKATKEELNVEWAAVKAAAYGDSQAEALYAAWTIVDATEAAARAPWAAKDASRAAAGAAWSAALATTSKLSGAALYDVLAAASTAGDAAQTAEQAWQVERLMEYLEGKV